MLPLDNDVVDVQHFGHDVESFLRVGRPLAVGHGQGELVDNHFAIKASSSHFRIVGTAFEDPAPAAGPKEELPQERLSEDQLNKLREQLSVELADMKRKAGKAEARGKEMKRIVMELYQQQDQLDYSIQQVLQGVMHLRDTASTCQSYIDQAYFLSRMAVPYLEQAYPCPEGDRAVMEAHELHVAIGRVKDKIGNPPDGPVPPGSDPEFRGVSDLFGRMARRMKSLMRSTEGNKQAHERAHMFVKPKESKDAVRQAVVGPIEVIALWPLPCAYGSDCKRSTATPRRPACNTNYIDFL